MLTNVKTQLHTVVTGFPAFTPLTPQLSPPPSAMNVECNSLTMLLKQLLKVVPQIYDALLKTDDVMKGRMTLKHFN